MTRFRPIESDSEFVEAGKWMRLSFAIGIVTAVWMFVALLLAGITWWSIFVALVAAVALVAGGILETERTSYRYLKGLKENQDEWDIEPD